VVVAMKIANVAQLYNMATIDNLREHWEKQGVELLNSSVKSASNSKPTCYKAGKEPNVS